jgi:hypothetical protein
LVEVLPFCSRSPPGLPCWASNLPPHLPQVRPFASPPQRKQCGALLFQCWGATLARGTVLLLPGGFHITEGTACVPRVRKEQEKD